MIDFKPEDFYSYFRACYKLDNREFTIRNVFLKKYKHAIVLEGKEELLSDAYPIIPLDYPLANELEKDLQVHQLDEELVYGFCLVTGKSNTGLSKNINYCAPLFIAPATTEKRDESIFISIEKSSLQINSDLLSKLSLKNTNLSKEEFVQKAIEAVISQRDPAMILIALIEEFFENLNPKGISIYPQIESESFLKSKLKNTKLNAFECHSAAGLFMVNKNNSSLPVLQDLKHITSSRSWSPAIEDLLTEAKERKSAYMPSTLRNRCNEEQLSAVKNAHHKANSVIVGPPGTGKSYTIGNIVADSIQNGESVLVVSKSKQAVEVVRQILSKEFSFDKRLIHTTGHGYKRSLISKINKIISGLLPDVKSTKDQILKLAEMLHQEELEFKAAIASELEIAKLDNLQDPSIWESAKKLFNKHLVSTDGDIWIRLASINRLSGALNARVKHFFKNELEVSIARNAASAVSELKTYKAGLTSQSFTSFKKAIDSTEFSKILKVFPIWLVHLNDLNLVLPNQKGLFDLVIIDEATQCDIASALPAIHRAKRVVVAGDPSQLKHYSFVSSSQQNSLRIQHQLPEDVIFDFRNTSILDLYLEKINSLQDLSFLREHFRSTPALIKFSNDKFYENQLKIIKSTPEHFRPESLQKKHCRGKRRKNGINQAEANAIISYVRHIIKEYNTFDGKPSIGIVCLFDAQSQHINNLLSKHFELTDLVRHNVICGTPFKFQGSEREIILLSTVVDATTNHSAFRHVNTPEVFNVAITRAKSRQVVFSSVSASEIDPKSLLSQYLLFIETHERESLSRPVSDQFQEEVVKFLSEHEDIRVYPSYPVAGTSLDILVIYRRKKTFIDLIGFEGDFFEALSIERYKTLSRAGMTPFPLHYRYWTKKNKAAKEVLLKILK